MGIVAAGRAEDCVGTLRDLTPDISEEAAGAEIDSNESTVGWPVFSGAMIDI